MSIHFISTPDVQSETDDELILQSRRRNVFNPLFVIGCVLFIASMFLKANVSNRFAAIPLGVSSVILLAGVWHLSANGLVVFSRNDRKVYQVFKHLGYVQKINEIPLTSIDKAALKGNDVVLQLDNLKTLKLCDTSELSVDQANGLVARINQFI